MSASEYPMERPLPALSSRARAVPADVWAVCGLVLVATLIRILTIDNQSLWADEALTAYEAHLPFGAMINTARHVETTPPLYFLLIWAWAHVFGIGAVALRSVSAIAGIALVPITYLATRELGSRRAGLVAAAFVTVNPFLIWYSQEARAYMLLAALSGLSFLFFARALRDPSRRNLVWWTVFSVAAITTHFFGSFLVAPEALWLLWRLRSRLVIGLAGIVGVVQVAVLPLAVTDTGHGVGWLTKIPVDHRVSRVAREWLLSTFERKGTVAEGLLLGLVVVAIVAGLLLVSGDRVSQRGAGIAAAVAAFVFIVPLALGVIGQDYFYPRNEIPAIVPAAVVLGIACAAPRVRVAGGMLAVALLAVCCWAAIYVQTHPTFERPAWQRVAAALGPVQTPRAILAADGTTAQPLKIYLPRVNWVQSHKQRVLVGEIDLVGAQKLQAIIPKPGQVYLHLRAGRRPLGKPLPMRLAPPGQRLLRRWRVSNWVLARFLLPHPERLSVNQIVRIAPRYFQHTPASLMVFFQGTS